LLNCEFVREERRSAALSSISTNRFYRPK